MMVNLLVFELKAFKGKIKGVLTGLIVAMVTNDVMKMATTCLVMIGCLFDILIVVATDNNL